MIIYIFHICEAVSEKYEPRVAKKINEKTVLAALGIKIYRMLFRMKKNADHNVLKINDKPISRRII